MASEVAADDRQDTHGHGALALVVIGLLATWVLTVGMPFVPVPPILGALLSAILLTAASFLALYGIARLKLSAWHEAALMVTCGIGWYVLTRAVSGDGKHPLSQVMLLLLAASGLGFLVACAMAGRLLSRLVREPNLLLAVLITAAAADVFTVFAGPTGEMLKHAPNVVQHLSMAVPQAGSAAHGRGMAGLALVATIGLGDYIFGALFLAAAWRHGLDARRGAIGGATCAVIGMACVLLIPWLPALPLLPFIAVGVLAPNLRKFKLTGQERWGLLIGMVFLAGLLVAFYFAMKGVGKH
jgi:hypothetical protein